TAATGFAVLALAACSNDSVVVSQNMTNDAQNFKIFRKITFVNAIRGENLLEVEGFCNTESNGARLEVLCKTETGEYLKHFLYFSDNVTPVIEQLTPAQASSSQYKFTIKPTTIIPNIEIR